MPYQRTFCKHYLAVTISNQIQHQQCCNLKPKCFEVYKKINENARKAKFLDLPKRSVFNSAFTTQCWLVSLE
ncbi:Carbamoyl-phosphate synthase large chain [Trichinella pseudospiralis]